MVVSISLIVGFASHKVDSFRSFIALCVVYMVGIFYENPFSTRVKDVSITHIHPKNMSTATTCSRSFSLIFLA